MSSIARVEPLTTARALRGPFDYRIPREMEGVGVGSVLLVPFGRRRILGLVVDVGDHTEVPREKLVEPRRAARSRRSARAGRAGDVAGRRLLLHARARAGARAAAGYRHGIARDAGRVHARAAGGGAHACGPRRAGRRRAGSASGPKQHAALSRLAHGPSTAAELGVAHGTLASLERRGLVSIGRREVARRPAGIDRGVRERAAAGTAARVLTAAQEEALHAVLEPLRERRHDALLLHGVTGSGKTEVYLRAADAALAQGRSAIVMVPEIALTPQTARRFEERFGERVAILHSKLGLGERYDEWRRLRDGQARICVGPRSAVFAPLDRSGIDRRGRGARLRVQAGERPALRRARRGGAQGPDVGRRARVRQRDAAARELAADAHPVAARARGQPRAAAGRAARHAGPAACAAPGRAPRARGRAHPRSQGDRAREPARVVGVRGVPRLRAHLDVPALRRDAHPAPRRSVRRGSRAITAGTGSRAARSCPDCGSTAVSRHGAGTQRVEAELREALAPLPVFRLDADAARRKHGIAETLARFDAADAGVLVGTQMVAQGHDFPEVELAVVQDADATLRFPDFRAEERTFTLVSQLAGRSGRGPGGGRVLVQTMSPDTACLRHAARPRRAGLSGRGDGAPPRAALPALLHADPRHRVRARPGAADRTAGRAGGAARRPRRARAGAAVPAEGPLPQPPRGEGRATEPAAVAAVGAAVREVAADRKLKQRQAGRRRRPAVTVTDAADCPFCKRIRGRKFLLATRRTAVAIPDAHPVNPGHCLVLPKRHEPDFFELTRRGAGRDRWSSCGSCASCSRPSTTRGRSTSGSTPAPAAGQTVDHAHVHLIPRYEGDVPDPRGGVRWVIPERAPYWDE